MTNWAITRVWFSPAAVAWTQLIAMSLVVAWTLKRLRAWGLSRAWALAAGGLVGIMPAAGILCITLWKDIPYTIAFLLMALYIMEILQSGGQWLQRPASAVALGVVLALVALYRHNGLPVALGTPLLLACVYYRRAFRLALTLLVACGLMWAVRGPLYRAVAARGPSTGTYHQIGMSGGQDIFKIGLAVNHIAAQMAAGTPLTDDERQFLGSLYPLEDGKWPYSLDGDNVMGLDVLGSWKKWEANQDQLARLALRLFLRNPAASLRHVALSSSYLWNITSPSTIETYYTVAFQPDEQAKYQRLRDYATCEPAKVQWVEPQAPLPRAVAWTFGRLWLFWRPALYLYLILFAVVIAALREGSLRLCPFLIPVLLQTGTLSLAAFTQEFRFQFPVYMIALLYGGYFLFCVPRRGVAVGQCL